MKQLRPAAPQLADIEPYDPKYIPADVMISANENPLDVPFEIRREIERAIRKVPFNRYPDPLANDLRDLIAEANGLERNQVLMGNGGDELLFDIALAYGGPGRKFLNMPPTFSVYVNNAQLTNTEVVNVPRRRDFKVDEFAVVKRLELGDIDYTIVTSPNNPTGDIASSSFVKRLLNASDTLVVVDEAYFEFSRFTVRHLIEQFENLVVLRTFSKAFSLAGVRMGYVLGSEAALRELKKVRQPYSVDAVSQAIARVVYEHRAEFEPGIDTIIEQREHVIEGLGALPYTEVFPSQANYVLFRFDQRVDAADVWKKLYDASILVRDFSRAPGLANCLRVSIGTEEENDRFLKSLGAILDSVRR